MRSGGVGLQPGEHFGGVTVRREDRVEDVLDATVVHAERQPLAAGSAVGSKVLMGRR
jgi:hypothetical protein